MTWREQAACLGMNVDVFVDPGFRGVALRACQGCPVRVDCLVDAISTPYVDAVCGGCTPKELRVLRGQWLAQQDERTRPVVNPPGRRAA